MPRNPFQRPVPVRHDHNVPRHGKPQMPPAKTGAKPAIKTPADNLPPLAALLEANTQK